jgi:hypothetical protein
MDTAFHEFTHDRFIFPSGKGALVSVNASHFTKQVAFGGFCLSERGNGQLPKPEETHQTLGFESGDRYVHICY